MTNASYHGENTSLSTTQFKLFCDSPSEYNATWNEMTLPVKEPTRFMDIGTVVHAVLLEKKQIDDLVRAYPTNCFKSNGHLNPNPANEFTEKIFPVIPMKDDEIERVQKICDSAMKSPLREILLSGAQFEQRLDAVIEGVPMRCKPDIHTVLNGLPIIWDLKTTERILPSDWWGTASRMGYGIQDAIYSLVAEKHYGADSSTFRFWAIETVKLHRVQPYWYDDRSREIAKDFVKSKLAEFAIRKETGNWADNWETTGTIGPWDLNQSPSEDNELVEWEGD